MKVVQANSISGLDSNTNNYLIINYNSSINKDNSNYISSGTSVSSSLPSVSALDSGITVAINGIMLPDSSNSILDNRVGFNEKTGMYTLEGSIPGTVVSAKASSALASDSYAIVDGRGNVQYVQYDKTSRISLDAPALMQSKLTSAPAVATPSSQPIGPGSVVFSMSMSDASLDSSYYSGGDGGDNETGIYDDQGNFAHVLGTVSPAQVVDYAEANLGGDPAAYDLEAGNTPGAVEDFLTKTQQAQSQLPSNEPAGDVAAGYAKLYDTVNNCVALTADIGEALFALAYGGVPTLVDEALSIGNAVDAAACALTGYNNYDADEKAAIGDIMNNLGKLQTGVQNRYEYGGPASVPNATESPISGQNTSPSITQKTLGSGSVNAPVKAQVLGSGLLTSSSNIPLINSELLHAGMITNH